MTADPCYCLLVSSVKLMRMGENLEGRGEPGSEERIRGQTHPTGGWLELSVGLTGEARPYQGEYPEGRQRGTEKPTPQIMGLHTFPMLVPERQWARAARSSTQDEYTGIGPDR